VSRRGWFLLALLGVIWGMPYLLIRIAVQTFEPTTLVLLRVVLAGAVLLPIAAARGELRGLRRHLPWIALFAVLEIGVAITLISAAEKEVTSSLAALVLASVPTIAAISARIAGLDDRLSGWRLVGLGLGFLGVIVLAGLDLSSGSLLAVVFLLIAAVCYAAAPIIVDRKLAGVPSLGVIAISMLVNIVIFAIPGVAQWPTATIPTSAWISALVLGLVCSAFAFIIFFQLIAEVGPARTTLVTYINPVVAVILGVAILSEPVTIGITLGFPLILLGSWLASRKGPALESEPSPT
jgi:drug/metabolite transporter (DMT)-like permease